MNKYFAVLAVASALVSSAFLPATAGVIITETETMVSGMPNGAAAQKPRERTVMIQGNKQKMVTDSGRSIITDLDKGTMEIVSPAQKSYFETPFPPRGMMAQAMGGPGLHTSKFTKTGKSRTIAGFKCDEYDGSGKFAMGEFTMVSCISTKAPGATEFSSFQKAMVGKLKDTQLAIPANMPDGIPMQQDTTTKMGGMMMPNLPPQAAEQLKKQFANRPPIVTRTEVTKIESKDIPASDFEIPADFTKREPLMAHPGMGNMGAGGMPGHPGGGPGGAPGGAPAPLPLAPPPANP